MCMHAHTWKCFYLLRNSHPNISNYSWQVQYCLLTMPEHGVCLGITRPSWHENEFANICFSFSGVSSSKKSTGPTWCLPEWWVKSPHWGWLVSDLYLKWFVVLWLFLLHSQIFFLNFFYVIATFTLLQCCSSWSFKKISNYCSSLHRKTHFKGQRTPLWQSSMVDLFYADTVGPVSAFDLTDLVRPAWGTACLWVSLALAASVLKEIRQQSHPLLALPCLQRGFYNVLLIFVGYCWPSKDIPCLLCMRRNAWLQLVFLEPSVKLMPWILFCR